MKLFIESIKNTKIGYKKRLFSYNISHFTRLHERQHVRVYAYK